MFFTNDKEIDMNLSRLFKWNKADIFDAVSSQENHLVNIPQVSNVIPLPINKDEQTLDEYLDKPKQSPVLGLMNAAEISEFFSENYFALGRHNGANFRTLDALDLGKKSLISKFQNTLTGLLENKQAKINQLKNYEVEIAGISDAITQQLKLSCKNVERQIEILTEQIESANVQKGWVLEALNRYQLGFMKGLNDVIEFELLAG